MVNKNSIVEIVAVLKCVFTRGKRDNAETVVVQIIVAMEQESQGAENVRALKFVAIVGLLAHVEPVVRSIFVNITKKSLVALTAKELVYANIIKDVRDVFYVVDLKFVVMEKEKRVVNFVKVPKRVITKNLKFIVNHAMVLVFVNRLGAKLLQTQSMKVTV